MVYGIMGSTRKKNRGKVLGFMIERKEYEVSYTSNKTNFVNIYLQITYSESPQNNYNSPSPLNFLSLPKAQLKPCGRHVFRLSRLAEKTSSR